MKCEFLFSHIYALRKYLYSHIEQFILSGNAKKKPSKKVKHKFSLTRIISNCCLFGLCDSVCEHVDTMLYMYAGGGNEG